MEPLTVPLVVHGERRIVTVWKSKIDAMDQGDEVAAWITKYIDSAKHTYRLVYMDHKFIRPTDQKYAQGYQTGRIRTFCWLYIV